MKYQYNNIPEDCRDNYYYKGGKLYSIRRSKPLLIRLFEAKKGNYWLMSIKSNNQQAIIPCAKFVLFLKGVNLPNKFRIEFLDGNTENHRIENLKAIKLDCTDDEFANNYFCSKKMRDREKFNNILSCNYGDDQTPRLLLQDLDKEIKGLFFRKRIIDNSDE